MLASPSSGTYREWRRTTIRVANRSFDVATKPGVFADGRADEATVLLAAQARIERGTSVVCLNAGNGLIGAVAATATERPVTLVDRNVISVEAARRTLDLNGVDSAHVLLGHGASALPAGTKADVVTIRIPHERLAFLQLLHDAYRILPIGGRCWFAGATNEGIKSATVTAHRLFGNAGAVAHGGGNRVALSTKTLDVPADPSVLDSPYLDPGIFREVEGILRGRTMRVFSRPGVFSWDHLDEATGILADAMTVRHGESVLDLGCGAGALGTLAWLESAGGAVCMVDADVGAVRSARRTALAAGATSAEVLTSDVCSAVRDRRFDVVVTNPPFHVGKSTALGVPLEFIHESWDVLVPGGRLYLVANRTLPYEGAVHRRFGNITTLHDGRRFKVLSAVR